MTEQQCDHVPQKHRGRPHITLRLEEEVLEELRRRAGTVHGRTGGVALYLRKLIYKHLGWRMPVQYGDLGRSSAKRKLNKRPGGERQRNA